MRLPTRLDRYPAKMVSHLARNLVNRYACDAERILDPFCGSGAVLLAAQENAVPSTGVDINPLAGLFSRIKLFGFDPVVAMDLASELIEKAKNSENKWPIKWEAKSYWFTAGTIIKFEKLRQASRTMKLCDTNEGVAVMLSLALSVRLCSKADQRSPKPFISKLARSARKGRHFDPYQQCLSVLSGLGHLFGVRRSDLGSRFILADVATGHSLRDSVGLHSHVITSPPYINAQDYFRNFKLELHVLEGVLPFDVKSICDRFIGTERGALLDCVSQEVRNRNRKQIQGLVELEKRDMRKASIVHRYFHDMARAFDAISPCISPGGSFILVCGDNLVGGLRIPTWEVLGRMLNTRGFRLYDRFRDRISDRLLAPKRTGHKGLIKEEVVSAFRLS